MYNNNYEVSHRCNKKEGVTIKAQIKINQETMTKLLQENFKSMSDASTKLNISRTQLWRILEGKSNPGEIFIASFKALFPKKKFEDFFLIEVLQQSDNFEN